MSESFLEFKEYRRAEKKSGGTNKKRMKSKDETTIM